MLGDDNYTMQKQDIFRQGQYPRYKTLKMKNKPRMRYLIRREHKKLYTKLDLRTVKKLEKGKIDSIAYLLSNQWNNLFPFWDHYDVECYINT